MYEIVGKLLVGQTSEVVAKYQNGKFWLIKNPADPTQTCWVWDETTRVTGNVASLPEATPPATPNVTLSLTIYAIISPILYADSCPVTVELIGNFTVNTPIIISYQWYHRRPSGCKWRCHSRFEWNIHFQQPDHDHHNHHRSDSFESQRRSPRVSPRHRSVLVSAVTR